MGDRSVSRRAVLGLGAGAVAAGALGGCSGPPGKAAGRHPSATPDPSGAAPSSASPSPSVTGGPAVEVVRASTGRRQVALTFHGAGDLSITRQVMQVLAAHQAHVTVLAVGSWVSANPDGIRMVRDGGHEIGNHTLNHLDMTQLGPDGLRTEIERCRDLLVKTVGAPGTFFRQSDAQHATPDELAVAGKAGYSRALSYDVDALDWRDPSPATVRRAVATAQAGSVVSMHLGHTCTVSALPGILTDLAQRGLTPVTASELFR